MAGAVLAIGAHPDDIEFMMSGTLILLGRAGWDLHCLSVASGSCGTTTLTAEEIVRLRREEAREACRLIGSVYHPGLVDDFEIFHTPGLTRRVGALVRAVDPRILLLPSQQDYMEDHVNTARIGVTAAFTRGMPNHPTDPRREPVTGAVTIYHALPYGLRGPLRERIRPGQYVDVSSVMDEKREMLACHRSQKEWIDFSQGIGAYLDQMAGFARQVGAMSGRFEHAEGWHRRNHLGFCGPDDDPLTDALGDRVLVDGEYEAGLERP